MPEPPDPVVMVARGRVARWATTEEHPTSEGDVRQKGRALSLVNQGMGDALNLPFPDGAFDRTFVGNLLGVLLPPERAALVEEARRVASELVVFATTAALVEKAEHWQERTLSDSSRYEIYRRYFTAEDLTEEIGDGRILFDGDHFVMVARQ